MKDIIDRIKRYTEPTMDDFMGVHNTIIKELDQLERIANAIGDKSKKNLLMR